MEVALMSTVAVVEPSTPVRVKLDLIDVGENVRELDPEHVVKLAASISLRGLIVPLNVCPAGERFRLVAGHHRYAACRSLGFEEVEVTIREQEGSSADTAAENVMHKGLNPLGEARAVQGMLDEGYTLEGAATILGWTPQLVKARAKILELPQPAQEMIGNGQLPVKAVGIVTKMAAVSPSLCEAVLAYIPTRQHSGEELDRNPGWVIGQALKASASKVFAAYLSTLDPRTIEELRLGKKLTALYSEAEKLHPQIDRHAYGPPRITFGELEVDQARAAGVLLEFDHGTPIITDRSLFRELAKQAIERTVQELRAAKETADAQRSSRRANGKSEATPEQELEAEHRASAREFKRRAHGTNLDLGAALLQKLATVDPANMDVARFFAYGVLGPDTTDLRRNATAAVIAATGIRLVFDEHRETVTPRLKNGGFGKTKVSYGEVEDAAAWMWKFIDGASNAGELYGRVLVVFAAQQYARQLVLAASKRCPSALPRSRKDTVRKAFERVTREVLPATHVQLARAIEREARTHLKRQQQLETNQRAQAADPQIASESEPEDVSGEFEE
jgi:ParB/RepB/Spo0J family partition protein